MELTHKEELRYAESQFPKEKANNHSEDPEELCYENSGSSQASKSGTKTEDINNQKVSSSLKKNECPGCTENFQTSAELQKHIILNIDALEPTGLRCNVAYQHVFKIDPDTDGSPSKLYECRQCGRTFKTKGEIKSHYLIHTEEKPFKCVACIAEFKRKTELRRHEMVHLNLFPYKCAECVKSFRTRGELKSHFLIHSNYRHFKCNICNLEFKRRAELNRHKTGHQTPSSSMCVDCRSLTDPNELKHHLMTVHGFKLHKCRYCNAEFVREDDLKIHSQEMHPTTSVECSICGGKIINVSSSIEGTIICPTCAKSKNSGHVSKLSASSNDSGFSTGSDFNESNEQNAASCEKDDEHDNRAAGDYSEGSFSCNECDKMFKSKAQLSSHQITHSSIKAFRCLDCGAEYRRKAELLRHALIHLQFSPFFCIHCNAKFRTKGELKSHLLVHSDIRPYKCLNCHCQYKRKPELKNHQLKCYARHNGFKSYKVMSEMLKMSDHLKTRNSTNFSLPSSTTCEPSQWYQPCINLNAVFSHNYRYGFT